MFYFRATFWYYDWVGDGLRRGITAPLASCSSMGRRLAYGFKLNYKQSTSICFKIKPDSSRNGVGRRCSQGSMVYLWSANGGSLTFVDLGDHFHVLQSQEELNCLCSTINSELILNTAQIAESHSTST